MTVKVAVRAPLYGKSAETRLIGSVFHRDNEKGAVFVADIMLPIVGNTSADKDYRTINELKDAKVGNYLLQLSLPNGKIKTENFEISNDHDTQIVLDITHEGSHEWTTFHTMTGKFKKEQKSSMDLDTVLEDSHQRIALHTRENQFKEKSIHYKKDFSFELPFKSKNFSDNHATPQTTYALAFLSKNNKDGKSIFYDSHVIEELDKLIATDLDESSVKKSFGSYKIIELPSLQRDGYDVFRFDHSGLLTNATPAGDFVITSETDLDRHYLVLSSTQGATLICLPTPMMTQYGQAEFELLIKKNSNAGQIDFSLTIADPMINTALGYINSGAIHQAAKLINHQQAIDMLYTKNVNPLGACVGGYLLVFGLDPSTYTTKADEWKKCLENLDCWFKWMPDGAILHAALYFMLGKGKGDRNEAYAALLRAYKRGLPFFTFGLKLMIDGMRYFAKENMPEAKEYLKQLENIALHTDPSQPFLCVNFSQH